MSEPDPCPEIAAVILAIKGLDVGIDCCGDSIWCSEHKVGIVLQIRYSREPANYRVYGEKP